MKRKPILNQNLKSLSALALLVAVAGCTSGNSALQPAYNSVSLSQNKLQVAVGVATFYDGTKGLNTVATYRQPNGKVSGSLLNTPHLIGPTNFVVPASAQAGDDAGTNTINGSPQVAPGVAGKPTTFGTTGGAFVYGFAPDNSNTSGGATFGYYVQPFYAGDGDPNCYSSEPTGPCPEDVFLGGAPAYPNFLDGTYPAGFPGFVEGFTTFYLTPVTGSYALSLVIQEANNVTFNVPGVTATLNSTKGLPAFAAAPTFSEDGTGGGTAHFTAPAGVTETLVNIQDFNTGAIYTIVSHGSGSKTAALADTLGPANGAGQLTSSLNAGDTYEVQLVGADYPAYEASPQVNASQTPTITGANGQSDVTLTANVFTYGGSGGGIAKKYGFAGKHHLIHNK
jgi:hypothetical protein